MKCPHCSAENSDDAGMCKRCEKEIKASGPLDSIRNSLSDVNRELEKDLLPNLDKATHQISTWFRNRTVLKNLPLLIREAFESVRKFIREHPTSGGYANRPAQSNGAEPPTRGVVACNVYFSPEDKSRGDFLDLLVNESGWPKEKVREFLDQNHVLVFRRPGKQPALELIARFEQIGIVATLEPVRSYYQKKFKMFKNGYRLTWNWPPAIFTFWWYLGSGCWEKALLLFTIPSVIYSFVLPDVYPRAMDNIILTIVYVIYSGFFGAYDGYLRNVKGEPLWPRFPYERWKRILWPIFWFEVLYELLRWAILKGMIKIP